MKVKGKVSRCGVSGIVEGVQEIERVGEGRAALMNDMLRSL